jgi:phytoene dehydrogenase-like protein
MASSPAGGSPQLGIFSDAGGHSSVGAADLISANARVAVIGAGMSGIMAASRLADLGVDVTMIEMGRGAGGRAATRREKVDGTEVHFDHGVQFFTATNPTFQSICRRWEARKIVHRWEPAAGVLDAEKRTFVLEGEELRGRTGVVKDLPRMKMRGSSGRLMRSWHEADTYVHQTYVHQTSNFRSSMFT